MDVLVGPTYGMKASVPSTPSSTCVRDRSDGVAAAAQDKPTCLFLKSNGGEKEEENKSDDSSESLSSIGDPDNSEEEEEEKEDANSAAAAATASSSKLTKNSTLCLDSLEDSLPIKRGLSNHYSGRSKSFANLSDVSTVEDLRKEENPFNKRRRLLMANKLYRKNRRSSFYSWQNPISMPLLPALEEEEDDDDDHHHPRQVQNLSSCKQGAAEKEEEEQQQQPIKNPPTKMLNGSGLKIGFKSKSCFSLADLQEDEDEDEDETKEDDQW
ncbi:uncharacterized protein DDB_G0283697-like [Mangifera indica]|uniref:uncharacterized protein DDB_G0283697-like n=1 Tax=Mangifera indica TaxID=29780 RepID=UPI001CF9D785|nr:uncharacterized protein DDB_G0283697-like [Mangifera indica]